MAAAAPLHAGRSHGRAGRSGWRRRSPADPMRGLALSSDPLRRRTHECQTLGWSAAVKPRSRAAVRRKAQGLIVVFQPQHNPSCPRSATTAAMTADVIFTSADAFDGPQLQSRIYASLTDVTVLDLAVPLLDPCRQVTDKLVQQCRVMR